MEEVRERLIMLKDARHVSTSTIIKETGLKKSAVYKIFKPEEPVDFWMLRIGTIVTLAKYFGVSVDYLYGLPETGDAAERELLLYYRDLNEEGKEKAGEYVRDLRDSGHYKKLDSVGMAKEA